MDSTLKCSGCGIGSCQQRCPQHHAAGFVILDSLSVSLSLFGLSQTVPTSAQLCTVRVRASGPDELAWRPR